MISDEEKLACVEREVKLRHSVYPRLVASGRMTQAAADHEIAVMESIAAMLRARTPDLFNS